MKYCPIHDVMFSVTCWCCDQAKRTASLSDQEAAAAGALDAAQKQLEAAKAEAEATETRIQATLDQTVLDAQAALVKATEARDAHRAKSDGPKP